MTELKKIDGSPRGVYNCEVTDNINGLIDSIDELTSLPTRTDSSVVIFGTSTTAQNNGTDGIEVNAYMRGYFTIANFITGGTFNLVNNAGVSGELARELLLRVDSDVIAYDPDICIYFAGANDLIVNVPYEQYIVSMQETWDKITTAGIKLIICTLPTSTNYTEAEWGEFNSFVRNYCFDSGAFLCDFAASYVDFNNDTWPYQLPDATIDGQHALKVGGDQTGRDLAKVLAPMANNVFAPAATQNDPFNILENPLLEGASISPTGWTFVNYNNNPDRTMTRELVNEGRYNAFKVVLTNSGSNNINIGFTNTITSGFTVGDTVRPYVELECVDGVDVETFNAFIQFKESGTETYRQTMLKRSGDTKIPSYNISGKMVFDSVEIPTGTDEIIFTVGIACLTGTLIMRKPCIMKVT